MAIQLALCGSELASVAGRTPHPFLGRETVYSGRRIRLTRTDQIGGRTEDKTTVPFFVSCFPSCLFLFYFFIFEPATSGRPSNVSAPVQMASSLTQARRRVCAVFFGQFEVGSDQSPFLFQRCCLLLGRIPKASPCICRPGTP